MCIGRRQCHVYTTDSNEIRNTGIYCKSQFVTKMIYSGVARLVWCGEKVRFTTVLTVSQNPVWNLKQRGICNVHVKTHT
jgi:hypothetical protein